MKGIFVLFAILAIANCSDFLRNLATCPTEDEVISEELCTACKGSWEDGDEGTCACAKGKEWTQNTGCTDTKRRLEEGLRNLACKKDVDAVTKLTTKTDCEECTGAVWTATKVCKCPDRYTFKDNSGCTAPTCSIETTTSIESAQKEGCENCFLKWDDTQTDAKKKCSCPTTDADKAKILNEKTCKDVCGFKWDTDTKKCSGMYIKIASALFGLLFLL